MTSSSLKNFRICRLSQRVLSCVSLHMKRVRRVASASVNGFAVSQPQNVLAIVFGLLVGGIGWNSCSARFCQTLHVLSGTQVLPRVQLSNMQQLRCRSHALQPRSGE